MRSISVAIFFFVILATGAQSWQWSDQIGGPGYDVALIAGADANSAIYLYGNYARIAGGVGHSDLYIGEDTLHGSNDAFLAKYSSNGSLVWARNCSSPNGSLSINDAFLDTIEQRLYVVGAYTWSCTLDTCSLTTPFGGAFLSQWTLDGHCLWARNVATNILNLEDYTCNASAVTVDQEGRILIGGNMAPYGPTVMENQPFPPGTYMAAYEASGDTIWTRILAANEGTTPILRPLAMRTWGGHLFAYNQMVFVGSTDTLTVDTVELISAQGSGYALFRMDPANGDLDWIRVDGMPYAPTYPLIPRRLGIDASGLIRVVGAWGTMAIFDTDTLSSTDELTRGFLSSYNADGVRLSTRSFESTEGTGFLGIDVHPDGTFTAIGFIQGEATWDQTNIAANNTMDLVVSEHMSSGQCMAAMNVGPAYGTSVLSIPGGLYMTGIFPPNPSSPPFAPITIGNDTYDSHGWEDIIVAKHELLTSTPQPMVVQDDGLQIYANPNRGSFRLRLPTALANAPELLLRIYNSSGQLVREQQLDMSEERPRMDVWDVGPGLYNVTVTNGRRTYSGSMVVE